MKKSILLLFAAILSLAVISACKKDKTDEANPKTLSGEDPEVTKLNQGLVAAIYFNNDLINSVSKQNATVRPNSEICPGVGPSGPGCFELSGKPEFFQDRLGKENSAAYFNSYDYAGENGAMNHNTRIEYSATNLTSETFSYSMWYKTSSTNLETVFCIGGDLGSQYIDIEESQILFSSSTSEPNPPLSTTKKIDLAVASSQNNIWKHLVVTRSKNKMIAYVDGIEKGSADVAVSADFQNPFYQTSPKFIIGAMYNGDNSYNNRIDDVRIFNRVLSASDVLAEYNYLKTKSF